MITLLTIIIAIICVMLMTAVLIQNSSGGGIDASFGESGAKHLFGAAKSTYLIEKITWGLAASLFIMCIVTAIVVNL